MTRSARLPLAALILLATLFVACKGKDKVADDPKAVLTAFFERMANKDIEGATKLATKDSKGTMDMMKKAIDAAENIKSTMKDTKEEDPVENFKSMEFGDAKIDGDKATVSVTNKKKNDTFDFPLTKEGGSWKVDFSMSTLMKMGMNNMNKQGTDTDTEGTDMNQMENFNLDSLKEGLEKAEDVLKNLDPEKLKNLIEDNN